MEKTNIDDLNYDKIFDDMSYEQLCDLEKKIAEKKKEFVSINSLYVMNSERDGELHLCYCSYSGSGTNPFYAGYYSRFNDVFNGAYVAGYAPTPSATSEFYLINYATENNIELDKTYYKLEELADIWKSINGKNDNETPKLKQKKEI